MEAEVIMEDPVEEVEVMEAEVAVNMEAEVLADMVVEVQAKEQLSFLLSLSH